MYCKKCGAEISESASFCGNCGNPVGNVSTSGMGKKKGIIVGGIGVIILAMAVVVLLFARGVFWGESIEVSINGKDDKSVQKVSLVESFDELLTLSKDEIISKNEDRIINKDNYLESDISDYMKKKIMEGASDEDICIDYRLPGFEGDMLLIPGDGKFDWIWTNTLPAGKSLYDYKDTYDALIHDFTKKYGEPDVGNSDGNDAHFNNFNLIKQGHIVGRYTVGYGWDKEDNIYQIVIGFAKSEDKDYVGDNDSSDAFDDSEDEDLDDDEDED